MPYHFFKCINCGMCCTVFSGGYQNSMTYDEMLDVAFTAPINIDILDWCVGLTDDHYEYWINPKTNNYVTHCPWLRHQKSSRYKKAMFAGYKTASNRHHVQAIPIH